MAFCLVHKLLWSVSSKESGGGGGGLRGRAYYMVFMWGGEEGFRTVKKQHVDNIW